VSVFSVLLRIECILNQKNDKPFILSDSLGIFFAILFFTESPVFRIRTKRKSWLSVLQANLLCSLFLRTQAVSEPDRQYPEVLVFNQHRSGISDSKASLNRTGANRPRATLL